MKRLLLLITLLHPILNHAQTPQKELWLGYISNWRLSPRWGIWCDFHFVTQSFFCSRQGLIFSPNKYIDLAGGYAYLQTATTTNTALTRAEHRPWAQIVAKIPLSPRWSYQARLRFDARFRANTSHDGFTFYNRIRLNNSLRFVVKKINDSQDIYLSINDELLYNFGKNIDEGIDQNRFFFFVGYRHKSISAQLGYHLRSSPSANAWTHRHGLTLWIIQTIRLYKNN